MLLVFTPRKKYRLQIPHDTQMGIGCDVVERLVDKDKLVRGVRGGLEEVLKALPDLRGRDVDVIECVYV
jgi:hypothetical protein